MFKKHLSKEQSELTAGFIFFIAATVLIVFVGARQNISSRETGSYLVNARFNVTDGLGVGAPVRLAGIRIGRVVNQRLDSSYGVNVTLSISKNVRLPDDTGASIQSTSLIGAKYIELSPGGGEDYLENGGDLFTLQRQMGHTDLQMTKRYTEISDKLLVESHQNYSPIGLLQDSSRRVKV